MFKRLKTILLPVAILAATLGVAPNAAAFLSETRVGGYQLFDAASRPAQPSQVPESQQANGFAWYDTASECSVAAKTPTYMQLEFPFARGASVQTPGVTSAGETFVRVGAGSRNLKFTFETPGGVQPGTYAFPESTFNAIGRDPAALKNLGDLPGAVPQYFRILQPPAGTPIQRGIVPGSQYGGVGGVEEVIFPGGF